MVLLACLRAWRALAVPVSPSASGAPATDGPDFGRSVAGEEDPGASVELPPDKPGAPGTGRAPCPECGGRGTDANGQPCPACHGSGRLAQAAPDT